MSTRKRRQHLFGFLLDLLLVLGLGMGWLPVSSSAVRTLVIVLASVMMGFSALVLLFIPPGDRGRG
ncbi:hypothetical protein [Kitasatospora sp. GP82]|uniref:hypothetical protein n=1 Tax=Kitasatospora sp. GP82 TaxID=3035089 RepID=UPI00247447F9|nr:hypothetical protein [Kitasatospora sp. GP82]MDH6126479.1 hypothetical protein [Kitasatospora sp. GP82]